ncbi:MAG: hypothetical protein AABX74_02610 [Nanoarchaeota archaeon]
MSSKTSALEKGIKVLFEKLGPVKTIEFFQALGLNKGDSLKEIESKTEKISKEEVSNALKKLRNAKNKPSMSLINNVIREVRAKRKIKK